MDPADLIRGFKDFFEEKYKAELMENLSQGRKFMPVDFSQLAGFSTELAESLLDSPEDTIRAAESAVQEIASSDEALNFRLRFTNLPKSQKIMIRNIRSNHINKLLCVEGLVRQKSDVRPRVVAARFQCPSCGTTVIVLQLDSRFKEPLGCSCGRKGKFRQISKEMVDAQHLSLEESPEELEGGEQPKRISIFLKEDLVSPMSEKRTNPGSKVSIAGIVKEVPKFLKEGGKSTTFDLIIEANSVEALEEDYTQITVTGEEEELIKELASGPDIFRLLINSIAPSIYGHERVKEALVLQLFGGVQKQRKDGVQTRGDIHILLVGDPGAGKSQLLKSIKVVAPKGRYVSGKGASGVGLTAAVVHDEFTRGYSLEAGALVLANNGICMIDEFDKMSTEDRDAIHEALEQQTISVAKANIQATLLARTTVLAAANPKYGRFSLFEPIAKQIDLPPTLLNRFDLIFPMKDLPNTERDTEMARFILTLQQKEEGRTSVLDSKLLKKYISYGRRLNPVLTEVAISEILNFYVTLRNKEQAAEAETRSVPISPRQLEALVRLAEASAKIRLSKKVTKEDARRAIELLHYCLLIVGIDPGTGKLDIDIISTGVSASERSHIRIIKEIIDELSGPSKELIPIQEVVRVAREKNIRESDVDEAIESLSRHGEVFAPRRGHIQKI